MCVKKMVGGLGNGCDIDRARACLLRCVVSGFIATGSLNVLKKWWMGLAMVVISIGPLHVLRCAVSGFIATSSLDVLKKMVDGLGNGCDIDRAQACLLRCGSRDLSQSAALTCLVRGYG